MAFVLPRGLTITTSPYSPAEIFYMTLGHPANVAYSAIYVTITVIADAFLVRNKVSSCWHYLYLHFQIYRLYIVWNGNRYITIIPSILCLGLLSVSEFIAFFQLHSLSKVTGSVVTYLFKHARQDIFGIARRWILACFILTFL